jgi:hypothetical protein
MMDMMDIQFIHRVGCGLHARIEEDTAMQCNHEGVTCRG